MDKAQKRELVTALNEVFSNTGVIVVAHYSGLSVSEMTEFRSRARDAGARVKVAKNRLVKLALEGTEVSGIAELFTGPTCITYSDDPVAAPKAAVNFAKENEKLVILGGTMGAMALDADGVKSLASLPSLDELRGKLVGLVQAPAGKIARVMNAPAGKLARVFSAKGNEEQAA
ncbi:MAG TPA: 50S ribosomal protein L10 [Rhizobiales bacterium]|nr:50S ribosomal protein L10 [bacterium BMS3Bbin10]HDO52374.1 50S ribosomal protein L10 [Hyphomicrobiales bacterium]